MISFVALRPDNKWTFGGDLLATNATDPSPNRKTSTAGPAYSAGNLPCGPRSGQLSTPGGSSCLAMDSRTRCPCTERRSEPLQGLVRFCIRRFTNKAHLFQYCVPLYEYISCDECVTWLPILIWPIMDILSLWQSCLIAGLHGERTNVNKLGELKCNLDRHLEHCTIMLTVHKVCSDLANACSLVSLPCVGA